MAALATKLWRLQQTEARNLVRTKASEDQAWDAVAERPHLQAYRAVHEATQAHHPCGKPQDAPKEEVMDSETFYLVEVPDGDRRYIWRDMPPERYENLKKQEKGTRIF